MTGINAISLAETGAELTDVSSTGRQRPWAEHKMANELLSAVYETIDQDKAARLRSCCDYISFRMDETGKKRLEAANFCRVRLCPICTWRRSLKAQAQMMQIASYLSAKGLGGTYILLTLTQKNVEGDHLSAAIDTMMRAWDRLTHRKRVMDIVKGYYRAMEITHNVIDNTFHPHFHVLFMVPKAYWHHGYLRQDEWAELWRQALKVDYTPVVDVRRVKGTDAAAIAEIAKYPTKIQDYIIPDDWDMTTETVRLLDSVLARRRFLAFGGAIADAHRRLHLDDVEDGDMVHIEAEEPTQGTEMRIVYHWYSGYRQYRADEAEIVPGIPTARRGPSQARR